MARVKWRSRVVLDAKLDFLDNRLTRYFGDDM
jgi:hypothetical protein